MSAAIDTPATVVDPAGRRHALRLSPAGHVALFARALHLHQPGEVRRRAGAAALVEAVTVARDQDGRVHPRRSEHPGNFPACGNVAALQAIAADRPPGGPRVLVLAARPHRARAGRRTVPGGRLLWADADTPDAVARPASSRRSVPLRLVVESGGATDPGERRLHLYLLADRWLDPDELEAANAALAERLGSDRVGDRGRLMRLPGTRNLKSGRPGAGAGSSPATCTTPASTSPDRRRPSALRTADRRAARRGNGSRPRAGALDALVPREWFAVLEPDREITALRLRALPAARRADPVAEALRPARGGLVLLGLRARGRPRRVRRLAPARATGPTARPRAVRRA